MIHSIKLFIAVGTGLGILTSTSPVAASSHWTAALDFFRSPTSLFTSGRAPRALLESQLERTELDLSYQATWNKKTYTLKPEDVITESDCLSEAKLLENTSLLKESQSNAAVLQILNHGAMADVLTTNGRWAQIRSHEGRVGWVPQHRLETLTEDPGVYIALVDTFLRKRPDPLSGIRTTLSKGSRVKPLAFQDGWLRVRYENKIYFVESRHFVGRSDFALWAWKKKPGQWLPISHREGTQLRTRGGELIPLSSITALSGLSEKAIVRNNEEGLPPLRAHAQIIKKEITQWAVSKIDGHGSVWWKQDRQVLHDEKTPGPWISTEELLKRKIYSYALVDSKKIKGLVSAQGVWKTTDGKFWRQIPEFAHQNWPVAIHSDGSWFVGALRSKNEGETFEPFIRWDQIAKTLEGSMHRQARYLKLQQIDPLPHSRLQIWVDTGVRRMALRTHLEGNTWQVVY